ncbi:MAG TPA: M56 family metallopeptidase [Saprospiraceae bacterium]|nr:M56 family metallopeptidase [Saprospiraceae bacterium]
MITQAAILLFKISSPRIKYNLYFSALIMCVVSFGLTIFYYLSKDTGASINFLTTSQVQSNAAMYTNGEYNLLEVLPVIWLIGIFLFSVVQLASVKKLKSIKKDLVNATSELDQALNNSIEKMAINRKVVIKLSEQAKTAFTYGIFTPVVVFPIAWLNQLTLSETEDIIKHELAHIVRNDYLHNILISVIKSLFYYHPAIWILARKLEFEREQACDELAYNVDKNPLDYSKTLVKISELSMSITPFPALAVSGNESEMAMRIKKIINMNMERNTYFSRNLLLVSVIFLSFFIGVAFAKTSSKPIENEDKKLTSINVLSDGPDITAQLNAMNQNTLQMPKTKKNVVIIDGDSITPRHHIGTMMLDLDSLMSEMNSNFSAFSFDFDKMQDLDSLFAQMQDMHGNQWFQNFEFESDNMDELIELFEDENILQNMPNMKSFKFKFDDVMPQMQMFADSLDLEMKDGQWKLNGKSMSLEDINDALRERGIDLDELESGSPLQFQFDMDDEIPQPSPNTRFEKKRKLRKI